MGYVNISTSSIMTGHPDPTSSDDPSTDSLIGGNVMFIDNRFIQPDIEVKNFPKMHRLFLGRTTPNEVFSADLSQLLPESIYKRLTYKNFAEYPVVINYAEYPIKNAENVMYDPNSGILVAPYLAGENRAICMNIYCYYNESVGSIPSRISGGVDDGAKIISAGTKTALSNFPGLYKLAIGSGNSNTTATFGTATYLPDIYKLLTQQNLGFTIYSGQTTSMSSQTGGAIQNTPPPFITHNVESGNFLVNPFMSYIKSNTGNNTFAYFRYQGFIFYNVYDEMVLS